MTKHLDLYEETKRKLGDRGVRISELADIVIDLQEKHTPDITRDEALENIYGVLKKREVQHAILTGILLDEVTENDKGDNPVLDIIARDEGLYGVDETLALSITNCYGSIASSTFGHLDITKPKLIGEFDKKQKSGQGVHTFLDDILSAIVAAACSRLAHNKKTT